MTIKTENTTAIYRAHLKLTEEDLNDAGAQIRFPGSDDEGWYFVNDQFLGESHDWQAQPVFDIKKFLHAGDNVIAVGGKQRQRPGRFESQRERGPHRQTERPAVVAQPVQRPGANYRAIHARRRRNQVDGDRRRSRAGDGRCANATVRAASIRAVNCRCKQKISIL